MAVRRPLVNISGITQELPVGDTLPGAGGSLSFSSVTVSVPTAQFGSAFVTVSAAGVTPTSKIICFLVPNSDYDADDLNELSVTATPLTDNIEFSLSDHLGGPIVGSLDISYMAG